MKFAFLLVSTLVSGCLLIAGCGPGAESAAPPPPEVLVAVAETRPVEVRREWVGTLDGSENAEI